MCKELRLGERLLQLLKFRDPIRSIIVYAWTGFGRAKPTSMINGVIRRFKELSVRKGTPCHCSGDEARRLFKEAYGDQGECVGLGSVFERTRAATG